MTTTPAHPDPNVERFLDWALTDRGRSPRTVARYRIVLRQLPDPTCADLDDISAWWDARRHLAPATRENELACLRSFYRWATRWDIRPDDPTRRLEAPKVASTVPRHVGRADLHALLTACDAEGAADLRRAFCLGAYAGLRVSEAAALRWGDISREDRRIVVAGKGAKERRVGLSPVLLDELLPEVAGNVVRAGGDAYSADALQRRANRFMKRHGIDLTFHALRKRWATLAIAKTGNVHAVAKAAGWASIETANTYAAMSDETLDAIAAAVV